jgi:AcrR family transcriptional regulator
MPKINVKTMSSVPLSKREQNRERTRDALMEATALIIAESGFSAATITRITDRAGIAIGTFYNYFDSPDVIFAELVVGYGQRLRDSVRDVLPDEDDFFAREEASFRAWFHFLHLHPFFLKVLNEAEIFSPKAFESYFEAITQGYRKVLAKAAKAGQIRKLDGIEIEAITLMLMAQRTFYGLRLKSAMDRKGNIDNRIVAIYLDLLRRVLLP